MLHPQSGQPPNSKQGKYEWYITNLLTQNPQSKLRELVYLQMYVTCYFLKLGCFISLKMNEANLSALIWNVRGLNNPSRREFVLDALNSARPNIVALQETKLVNVDHLLARDFLGNRLLDFFYIPSSLRSFTVLQRTPENKSFWTKCSPSSLLLS